MRTSAIPTLALAGACALAAGPAAATPLGSDRDACIRGHGPAIHVAITGLKDRTGRLKLELYPANEEDFLKDDRDLEREGKFFRRIWAEMPKAGPVEMCIRAPSPGRYALLFTHDRDGRNKFNVMQDGAGFPGGGRIGRARPRLAGAVIAVPAGVARTTIRVQYLRGLGGFAPLG